MNEPENKEESDLKKEIKCLRMRIGRLHADACSYRIKKDFESTRMAHRQIEIHEAEINECQYLIEAQNNGNLLETTFFIKNGF